MLSKYETKMIQTIQSIEIPNKFTFSSPSKISLKPNCAFSLPAKISCPGATLACEDCYAQKKRHMFCSVQKAFARNWVLLKKFEDKNDIKGMSDLLIKEIPNNLNLHRIFESGDFSSLFVVNVWNEVIKQKPKINFWAYTRSFDLDFEEILKNSNFNLFASTDKFNSKQAEKFVKKYKKYGVKFAYGPWDKNEKIPNKSFVCPSLTGKIDHIGACEKCKLCVIKNRTNKNVVFYKH